MYLKQIVNNYSQNMKSTGILNPIINDEETEKLVQVKEIKSKIFLILIISINLFYYNLFLENDSLFKEILLGFSAIKNTKKIFDIGNTEGQLECLNGIRFISIAWVILGHTYLFVLFSVGDNLGDVFSQWLKRFSFAIISNATYSVDSFFLLRYI
jgi:hypothetical protein